MFRLYEHDIQQIDSCTIYIISMDSCRSVAHQYKKLEWRTGSYSATSPVVKIVYSLCTKMMCTGGLN